MGRDEESGRGAERKRAEVGSMHWEFVRILAYGCRITKCVIDRARMSRSRTGEAQEEESQVRYHFLYIVIVPISKFKNSTSTRPVRGARRLGHK